MMSECRNKAVLKVILYPNIFFFSHVGCLANIPIILNSPKIRLFVILCSSRQDNSQSLSEIKMSISSSHLYLISKLLTIDSSHNILYIYAIQYSSQ